MKFRNKVTISILYVATYCFPLLAMENASLTCMKSLTTIDKKMVKEHNACLSAILDGLIEIIKTINSHTLPQEHQCYYQDLQQAYPALQKIYQEEPFEIYESIGLFHKVLTENQEILNKLTQHGWLKDETIIEAHNRSLDEILKLKNAIQSFFTNENDRIAQQAEDSFVKSFFN